MPEDTPSSNADYYKAREKVCLAIFDQEAIYWTRILAHEEDETFARVAVKRARLELESLLPQLPNIGGDANPFMREYLRSVRYLAFFKAMHACGKSAPYAGRTAYEAIQKYPSSLTVLIPPPLEPPTEALHRAEREKAERSQLRIFPADYAYEYIAGDGVEFDFGYDFSECASYKLYLTQGALDYLPFFCFTDFALSRLAGHGLRRTQSLSEGHALCNHRMRRGRKVEPEWPPAFLPAGLST